MSSAPGISQRAIDDLVKGIPHVAAYMDDILLTGETQEQHLQNLARSYVWWPNMDADLEAKVRTCTECQSSRPPPASAPLHPWPQKPWSQLHLDYAGPFVNRMFLVLVDAHSKWLEVVPVSAATSTATIEKLQAIFATHGLLERIVTDNGTVFTSEEFENFLQQNGIAHTRTGPYHLASNGLAERAVQTFKQGIK